MTNRIVKIHRNSVFWSHPIVISSLEGEVLARIPKPENMIICDGCNVLITTEFINCLSFKKGFIHSAQCDVCVAQYFSKYKIVEECDA